MNWELNIMSNNMMKYENKCSKNILLTNGYIC